VSDYPFKNSIFWCNVFPPEVYAALDDLWIPSVFMHQDKRSGRSKKASHKNADQRFKCSLDDFLKTNDAKGLRCVDPRSAPLWKPHPPITCPRARGAACLRVGSGRSALSGHRCRQLAGADWG